jgi:hypothetical protein
MVNYDTTAFNAEKLLHQGVGEVVRDRNGELSVILRYG